MAESQEVSVVAQPPARPEPSSVSLIAMKPQDNRQISLALDNEDLNQNPLVPAEIVPPFEISDINSDGGQPSTSDGALPSALFVLPFPAPLNARRSKNTPPFLLYSPPRAMYKRPAKDESGKRGKEKIVKKLVRIWQQEVAMGDRIKRGSLENPTRLQKIRGGVIRVASTINKWLPNSCIETLSRLPPQSKLGTVTLIHPVFQQDSEEVADGDQSRPYVPAPDELINDMRVLLRKTRKRILKRAILSGMLLPISLGIDVFAPVFAFEINMTYFAFQLYGLKKAKCLLASPKKKCVKRGRRSKRSGGDGSEQATLLINNSPSDASSELAHESQLQMTRTFRTQSLSSPALDPVLTLMYDICSKIDPVSFPPRLDDERCASSNTPPSSSTTLPPNLKRPGGIVVKEMIEAFNKFLPAEVTERYLLDQEVVSEDLARYIKKASEEYIDSLSGRSDRKGVVHDLKTWRKKSILKKEQAAKIAREKREEKKARRQTLG